MYTSSLFSFSGHWFSESDLFSNSYLLFSNILCRGNSYQSPKGLINAFRGGEISIFPLLMDIIFICVLTMKFFLFSFISFLNKFFLRGGRFSATYNTYNNGLFGFSLLCMDGKKYSVMRRISNTYITIFSARMEIIKKGDQKWIVEYRFCFFETNFMFSEILVCFIGVPLKKLIPCVFFLRTEN